MSSIEVCFESEDRVVYIYIYTDKTSLKADREDWGGGGGDSLGLTWTHLVSLGLEIIGNH